MEYLQRSVDITNFSNFKTPAKAESYFEINTIDDLEKLPEIYQYAQKQDKQLLYV